MGSQAPPDYQTCIAGLRTEDSVLTVLGYVPTAQGTRASDDVIADVETYAGWVGAYALDGVYFDQVSATTPLLDAYTTWTQAARRLFGGNGFVRIRRVH